ncbi:hypothetical protein FRB90_002063, partial [Tulasnella sp. 427]
MNHIHPGQNEAFYAPSNDLDPFENPDIDPDVEYDVPPYTAVGPPTPPYGPPTPNKHNCGCQTTVILLLSGIFVVIVAVAGLLGVGIFVFFKELNKQLKLHNDIQIHTLRAIKTQAQVVQPAEVSAQAVILLLLFVGALSM